MNLGPNEVTFEVEYDLKATEGVELIELTIPNGEENTETGWSLRNTRLGVLRPNEDGEGYQVINYGTGW